MPELAEVYFHCGLWKKAIGGRFDFEYAAPKARCLRVLQVDLARKHLVDQKLVAAFTHGKRMLFQFGKESYLEVHLGMTGSLHVEDVDYRRGKHDHFLLSGKSRYLVFRDPRQFGKVALHFSEGKLPDWWLELPPEPHSDEFNFSVFENHCRRRSRAVLKSFLLLQEIFPGVGNWMADEILWQARITPARKVGTLSQSEMRSLYDALRFVCIRALETIGKDYRDPPKSWLFLHRWKDGGNCPKTQKPLQRETIGGRTTCWSPAWQK